MTPIPEPLRGYRFIGPLGAGASSTVWEAEHVATGRIVAIKLFSELTRVDDREMRRFHVEGRIAARLSHSAICAVHELWSDAPPFAIVMDRLRGETLRDRLLRDETLSVAETACVLSSVADALVCAHGHDVLHRDLKPENVFLHTGPSGTEVKLLDFGVAKLQGTGNALFTLASTTGALSPGTPAYMSPEQLYAANTGEKAGDLWSLGVMLYECLSGGRPFEGETLPRLVRALESGVVVPLSVVAPRTPARLCALADRLLVRDPTQRLADARQVVSALWPYTGWPAR